MRTQLGRTIVTAAAALLCGGAAARAQDPAPRSGDTVGPYAVTSSVEVGVRGLKVDGDADKYRSDLNYQPGFQLVDSSFEMKAAPGEGGLFDNLLVHTTGWDSDPAGYARVDANKLDVYRFSSTVRRVNYFNALKNLALGQHADDTEHTFGDATLMLFPESKRFRPNVAYEFDRSSGATLSTYDFSRDEFPLFAPTKTRSDTFTGGFDATVGKADLSFRQGYRRYREDASFFVDGPQQGNDGPAAPASLTAFAREVPTRGRIFFTRASAHTLLDERFDLTGRFVYSHARSTSTLFEDATGTDFTGAPVPRAVSNVASETTRPQTLADVGVTVFATDQLTISDTFRFNWFEIDGAQTDVETLLTSQGGTLVVGDSLANRLTRLRHASNLFEIDYQFHPRVNAHVGYRYTDRSIDLQALDAAAATPEAAEPETESFDNRTNTFVFGLRANALPRAWTIYFDLERGEADNVFTRTANYDTNSVRLRNRIRIGDTLTIDLSGVARDNDNPSLSEAVPPVEFGANTKSRIVSASADWTPSARLTTSSGFSYTRVTSTADVIFFYNFAQRSGQSQYFMRDKYAYVSASAVVAPRVSVYGAFRIHDDNAAGDRVAPSPDVLISSYPYRYYTPEVRASVRLNDRVDLALGYQYYRFLEKDLTRPVATPATLDNQNYRAHLPFVSLRFYLGRGE